MQTMPDAATLATIASIISGFGVTALVFRIQRELEMARRGEQTWITWADRLLIGAVLISLLLVVLPLASFPGSPRILKLAASMCSASTVLVGGYIPSILAHYRLAFGRNRVGLRDNPEPAERVWVYVTILLSVAVALAVLLKSGYNH